MFLFTTLVFGTVFSLPRYSRTDVGVLEPFDPVSGMLGGMCLAAVITAVWAVFRPGSD